MPNDCPYCGERFTDFSEPDGGIEMWLDETEDGEPVIAVEAPYAMSIRCPNCGGQIGRINKGNVFVCEKGKPLMREVRYYCRRCDSTIIFPKRCEQEGVCNDR